MSGPRRVDGWGLEIRQSTYQILGQISNSLMYHLISCSSCKRFRSIRALPKSNQSHGCYFKYILKPCPSCHFFDTLFFSIIVSCGSVLFKLACIHFHPSYYFFFFYSGIVYTCRVNQVFISVLFYNAQIKKKLWGGEIQGGSPDSL